LEAYQEPGHARLQRIHEERARDWAPPELLGASHGSNHHFLGEDFGARPQIPAILGVNYVGVLIGFCHGFAGFAKKTFFRIMAFLPARRDAWLMAARVGEFILPLFAERKEPGYCENL